MKRYSYSIIAAIAGIFLCASGALSPARAESCSFSVTSVAFGTVNVTLNANVDTTATLSITCKMVGPMGEQVCINFGSGSGGATNAANRTMISGANTLTYGLFSDAGRTTPWGSNFWGGGSANAVIVKLPSGNSTTRFTVYGRVYSGQQTVNAGSYLSSYSSTNAEIQYQPPPPGGGNCTGPAMTATTRFNVTATVPTTCSVSATNLNFGTVGTLASNTDATSTISPTCSNGAPYNVGLNQGVNGSSVTTRQMKAGSALVNYSLFSNSGRTTNWGNTVGTDTVSGTGTGSAQSLTVYGRIPPQTTPAPNTYTDTIVVTLTY